MPDCRENLFPFHGQQEARNKFTSLGVQEMLTLADRHTSWHHTQDYWDTTSSTEDINAVACLETRHLQAFCPVSSFPVLAVLVFAETLWETNIQIFLCAWDDSPRCTAAHEKGSTLLWPREAVDAPALEVLQVRLDEALGNLILWVASLSMAGCWSRMVL